LFLAGAAVGTALTYPISGLLIDYMGWESVFYFVGGISLLWCVAWFMLIYDTPSVHPRISYVEKYYLEHKLCDVITDVKVS
jgi:ACS family sodium-dependent inorganic phosphate cotransporter